MPITLVVLRSSESDASPPRLSPGRKAEPERAVTFDGTRVVIGRSAASDLVLPDSSVSQRHASVRTSGPEYALVDEGSTNGTWVGGLRLTPQMPRLLRTGDRIRVGRLWLEVRIGAAAPTRDIALATRDIALALVAEMLEASGGETLPRLVVRQGIDAGAVLRLVEEERGYVVGRGESCDLSVEDADCSREHVVFVRRGAAVSVVDLGSKNGSYLGGGRLPPHHEVPLASGRMIQIGRTVLAYEEPMATALARLDGVADELVAEEEAPPQPGSPPPAEPPPVAAPSPESAPRSSRGDDAPLPRPSAVPSQPLLPRRARKVFGATEVAVVLLAVTLIGLSIAGLSWVLKP